MEKNTEKQKCKLIIGFLASNSSFYDSVVRKYITTFQKYIDEKKLNVKFFLMYDQDHTYPDEVSRNVYVNEDKNRGYVPGLTTKTINFFKFINKNFEYQYLFRTNLSSFIDIDRLLEVLEILPEKEIYSGNIAKHLGIKYIGGAGIIFSKDRIDFFLKNYTKYIKWIDRLVDDVFIGLVFQREKKRIFNIHDKLPETNIKSEQKTRYEPLNYKYRELSRPLNKEELEKIYQEFVEGKFYHTRIVNKKEWKYNNLNERKSDIQIFEYLIEKYF